MPLEIKDIAKVCSGLVVTRKKAIYKNDVIKSYKQLNLKSINKKGYIEFNELDILEARELIDSYYLTKEGDIVMRLTDPFTAVYISKEMEGIVVSSNFCIIKCSDKYNAIYLSYYINSDAARKDLLSNLQGYIIKNINMTTVEELQIPPISLKKQELIGKILRAQTQKIIILNKIEELEIKLQKEILKKVENNKEV